MKHLFIWLLWALVIAGVCVVGDQFLQRSSLNSPIYDAAQTFYQDFRGRIISFVKKNDLQREGVTERWSPPTLPALGKKVNPRIQPEQQPSGYVYSDKDGGLHLTSRLDEIPKEYRTAAKPLQK